MPKKLIKKLFLVDGAAGFEKEDLAGFIKSHSDDCAFVNKFTTRTQRTDELETDMEYVDKETFDIYKQNEYSFSYQYGDSITGEKDYAFYKSKLDETILRFQNTFLVIRNRPLTREIYRKYQNRDGLLVVPIFIYASESVTRQKLEKKYENHPDKNNLIEIRMRRREEMFNNFLNDPDPTYRIIPNNADGNAFQTRIKEVIYEVNQKDNQQYLVLDKYFTIITHRFTVILFSIVLFSSYFLTSIFAILSNSDNLRKISENIKDVFSFFITFVVSWILSRFFDRQGNGK